MSSWFQRIKSFIGSGRKYAGKDLEGNKYYEYPVAGIRPKRMVKYRSMAHLSDYTSGKLRLPVQWTAWLTFTRTNPPTLEELQTDHSRRQDLGPRIAAIEERERLERIRQGYAIETKEDDAIPRIEERSFTPPPVKSISGSGSEGTRAGGKYHVPTPTSPGVAEVGGTVDPSRHASPEELRRLAEEDTKRRMKESGGVEGMVKPNQGIEGVGLGGSLKPRRRGGA